MNFLKKLKIARLVMRVMALQRKAPKDTYYSFDYHGSTNVVEFWKLRKGVAGDITILKRYHCYLDETFGLTLDAFARQVKKEAEEV